MKTPATVVSAIAGLLFACAPVRADNVGCVTTAWKFIGANHEVCVDAFHDLRVRGVTCHVSQARTGGVSGSASSHVSDLRGTPVRRFEARGNVLTEPGTSSTVRRRREKFSPASD